MKANEMNPVVWGPHYWFFLHTICMIYPQSPNAMTKKRYFEMIQQFPLFIPNESISKRFEHMLNEYPVSAYLDSRESLMKWMHFIHNKINERLEIPSVSFNNSLDEYTHQYTIKSSLCTQQWFKWRNKVLFAILLFMLSILVVYVYKQ